MNTFHGYLLCNMQRRSIIIGQCLLSLVCKKQGIPLCGSYETKVRSACSNETVCKGCGVGALDAIVCDMASNQLSSEVKQFCNGMGMMLRALEEGTLWVNKAELYIKLVKVVVRKDMREADSPFPFWDSCLEIRVQIYNLIARDHIEIRGTMPHTATPGEEGDSSNLCQYKWYDWCYYREHTAKFPHNQEFLGCVLGPSRGEDSEMAQWVLKANGNVVPRCSLQPLQVSEIQRQSEIMKLKTFNCLIKRRWGTSINPPKEPI